MEKIEWNNFNADKLNPKIEKFILKFVYCILESQNINIEDYQSRMSYASLVIKEYDSGKKKGLNKILGVDVFKPHEIFDNLKEGSLSLFVGWLEKQDFDWKSGSESIKKEIYKEFNSFSTKIKKGRTYYSVDNLIQINDYKCAIEVEISKNLDNGYSTLRQSIRQNKADFGIMLVPWDSLISGNANESLALSILDQEFDGIENPTDGPIYRIAVIRLVDIYLRMKKKSINNYT